MTYNPNANWTAAIAAQQQQPVYYIDIDGVSTNYSTAPVQGATTTVLMNPPSGGGGKVGIIEGTKTVSEMSVELIDIGDVITDLVSSEAPSAPVSTLINRKVTVYGGYRHLDVADYAAIFTGRISGVKMNRNLTGYVFQLSTLDYLLDQDIMTGADEDTSVKTTITGNIANIYWAILSGTFSTTHSTFPLDSVSTDTTDTAAPTGLDIPSASINETQIESQRDTWHPTTEATVVFTEPENAKDHLENELFRTFQCFPTIGGDGSLGLRFHLPGVPLAQAQSIDTSDNVIETSGWMRVYQDHLNKFTYKGDYDEGTDSYDAVLYNTVTAGDTTNQSNTEEVIEYLVESRWLTTAQAGATVTNELAGRMRLRYLATPAEVMVETNFSRRNVEEGDVVALTDARLPNLLLGTRGVTDRLMTVISVGFNYATGRLKYTLLDNGYTQRYGVVGTSGQPVYGSASDLQKNTFAFIGASGTNLVGGTDPGYGMI